MGRPKKNADITSDVTDNTSEVTVEETKNENTSESKNTNPKKLAPLDDKEEVEVIALVPNVSYEDKKTGDIYEWKNVGDVELMTVETLKNMHRSFRAYFTNLWIKPNDERVIKELRLERNYEQYEKVLTIGNYKKDADAMCDIIKTLNSTLKFSIFMRIQNWVSNGDISDIKTIKTLERRLGLDLFDLVD